MNWNCNSQKYFWTEASFTNGFVKIYWWRMDLKYSKWEICPSLSTHSIPQLYRLERVNVELVTCKMIILLCGSSAIWCFDQSYTDTGTHVIMSMQPLNGMSNCWVNTCIGFAIWADTLSIYTCEWRQRRSQTKYPDNLCLMCLLVLLSKFLTSKRNSHSTTM